MKTTALFLTALTLAPIWSNAEKLSVDPHNSWVKVDARATGHSFSGKLTSFSASISGDEKSLTPQNASIEWNFSNLKTGDAKRDAEMLKWLEHAKNPKGSFNMNKTWVDADGKTWAQGVLNIHGVTKTISFPVTARNSGGKVQIDGSVWIDYQNFNLPIVRNMAIMTVDPKLKISFHLEGDAQ